MKRLALSVQIAVLLFSGAGLLAQAPCPADFTVDLQTDSPACPWKPVNMHAATNRTGVEFRWDGCSGWFNLPFATQADDAQIYQSTRCQSGSSVTVTIRDPLTGCQASSTETVSWHSGAPPRFGQGDDARVCGMETHTVSIANGAEFSDIVWSVTGAGRIVSGQGTAALLVEPTSLGDPMWVNLSAKQTATGCLYGEGTDYEFVPLTIDTGPVSPQLTVSAPDSMCPGARGTASVALDSPGQPPAVAWKITNGNITSAVNQPSVEFTAGAQGYVTLSVQYRSSGYFCYAGDTVTIPIGSPTATLDSSDAICRGGSATIPVRLTGTAPFTIVWSDGETQQSASTEVTRVVTPEQSTTYSIVSVSSGSCTGTASGSAVVAVSDEPVILDQPFTVTIRPGMAATLSVLVSDPRSTVAWYERLSDGQLVLRGSGTTFVTPSLQSHATYVVTAVNGCGIATSDPIEVRIEPSSRRRSVRH